MDDTIYIFGEQTTEEVIQQGRFKGFWNIPHRSESWSEWRDCSSIKTGKIKTCGCTEHRMIKRTITEEVIGDE